MSVSQVVSADDQISEFYIWLTVHLELFLHNKPTRCTVYLHFIELPRLYMFRAPFVAHHQEAASV
jgi:hypothetical protein